MGRLRADAERTSERLIHREPSIAAQKKVRLLEVLAAAGTLRDQRQQSSELKDI
jgi:hypothetical protein